jgi:hypothetical protein
MMCCRSFVLGNEGNTMTDWKERAERAEAELARLRAQVPVGWIGPSGFTHNTATNRMWMRESPKLAAKLSPVYAAPPAQPAEPVQPVCSLCQGTGVVDDGEINCYPNGEPYENGPVKCVKDCPRCANKPPAEPVQRLSDAGIEALAGKHGTTYRNRHFPTQPAFSFSNGSLHRFVRDIESAIQPQPGWRDVESAPKDGTDVWLHADGKVLRAFWLVKPYRETRDLDGNYLDHQDYDEFWMSCADGDEVEDPTEWQPLVTPLPPKAAK